MSRTVCCALLFAWAAVAATANPATPTQLWSYTLDSPIVFPDQNGVATAPDGSFVAVVGHRPLSSSGRPLDVFAIDPRQSTLPLWTRRVGNGTVPSQPVGAAVTVALDAAGRAVTVVATDEPSPAQPSRLTVSRINANGSEAWTTGVSRTASFTCAVAVDLHHGVVFVVGNTGESWYEGKDALVVRLRADDGAPLSTKLLGGSGGDLATDAALSGDGGIFVVGATNSPSFEGQSPCCIAGTVYADVWVARLAAGDQSTPLWVTLLGANKEYWPTKFTVAFGEPGLFVSGPTSSSSICGLTRDASSLALFIAQLSPLDGSILQTQFKDTSATYVSGMWTAVTGSVVFLTHASSSPSSFCMTSAADHLPGKWQDTSLPSFMMGSGADASNNSVIVLGYDKMGAAYRSTMVLFRVGDPSPLLSTSDDKTMTIIIAAAAFLLVLVTATTVTVRRCQNAVLVTSDPEKDDSRIVSVPVSSSRESVEITGVPFT